MLFGNQENGEADRPYAHGYGCKCAHIKPESQNAHSQLAERHDAGEDSYDQSRNFVQADIVQEFHLVCNHYIYGKKLQYDVTHKQP